MQFVVLLCCQADQVPRFVLILRELVTRKDVVNCVRLYLLAVAFAYLALVLVSSEDQLTDVLPAFTVVEVVHLFLFMSPAMYKKGVSQIATTASTIDVLTAIVRIVSPS